MPNRTWNQERAENRIVASLAEVGEVKIRDYARDMSFAKLANGEAIRVDAVHLYVDILNMEEMLWVHDVEGVRAHERTLRFLNLHFRAVRRILLAVDAVHVDFHNQRLHAVFPRPYNDEQGRLYKAVATAQLIIDVLRRTGEGGADPLPAAKVRVGIDSGVALAVNNGRRGHREPLFLGSAANLAAKRATGGAAEGIFLTDTARNAVDFAEVEDVDATALTEAEIERSQDAAALGVSVDKIVREWSDGLANSPIDTFQFSAHTPPFEGLDLELLTPANSRRQDAVSIYADIDGFTSYVGDRVDDDESAKDVVRVLHVLRAELDAVLHRDFAGRKIRFIGDCVHGVMVEGTAATTDGSETAKNALLCAAAMRSSFGTAVEALEDEGVDTGELGLAIGLEFGPIAITRLGVKGEKIRCCLSRAVLASEAAQRGCNGDETGVGLRLLKLAPDAFKSRFDADGRVAGFDFEAATAALNTSKSARAASTSSSPSLLRPATSMAAAEGFSFSSTPSTPSKTPAGFA